MPTHTRTTLFTALAAGLALVTGACDQKPAANTPAPAPANAPAPKPAANTPKAETAPAGDATAALGPRSNSSDLFGIPEPLPRTPGALRVATYNLENLFDDQDDPKLSGKFDDLKDAKPAAQMEALAAAIRKIDADVLAVEEIESEQALRAFRDKYLTGMGYDNIVSLDSGDDRGIEQAVLSRFPLENAKVWPNLPLGGVHPDKFGDEPNDYAGQPITYRRSPLRVDVVAPADAKDPGSTPYRLTLFVVHHKSGRGGGYWREAEAKKAVDLIAEAEAATPFEDNVIVLGDFNAMVQDDSVKTYLEHGFVPADRLARDNADVKSRHWKSSAWTTHASGRTIDLILLNPGVQKEFIPQSMFILNMPQRPRGTDWRTTAPPPGYASDHQPVVIDLVPRDK